MQKRTMLAWFEFLDTPGREYSDTDFMALMLFHIRQSTGQSSGRLLAAMQALEHLEAMVGTIDRFLYETNPRYRQLADERAKPKPEPEPMNDDQKKLAG